MVYDADEVKRLRRPLVTIAGDLTQQSGIAIARLLIIVLDADRDRLDGGRNMNNSTMRFTAEHKLFSYAFAALVSLSSLPLLAWHYWRSLDGVAVLSLVGLALTDLVLWQSTHWSVRSRLPIIRATALISKIALSLVMLLNAGAVVILIRESRSVDAREQARLIELRERIAGAERLAASGARSAAKEIAKTTPESSGDPVSLVSVIPTWYREIGVYCLPPVAALLIFFALSIVASLAAHREDYAEIVDFEPRSVSMMPSTSREIDARPM